MPVRVPNNPSALGLRYETWWPHQREIIQEIANSSQRIVLLRARTGFGKMAVAAALSKLFSAGVLVLTQTHQLAEQYRQFGAVLVKGRRNFNCPIFHVPADVAQDRCGKRCQPTVCPYARQKLEGELAPFTVTNYAYALRLLRNYGGFFRGRSWLVCDEGQHLMGAIESVLVEEEAERAEREERAPTPPPLWPSKFFPQRVSEQAQRVLVMSATLAPKKIWAGLHDVPERDILFIEAPDTWPKNSPVYIWSVAALSKGASSVEYDKLAQAITTIMDTNPNHKGLIHPHSYAMMEQLRLRLPNPRIVFSQSKLRNADIARFLKDNRPIVLCACGVNEGFDYPYGIAFQIIPKVPFPNLGDPLVAARRSASPDWYAYETVNAIVQAIGRVARAPDDYGETWVLDSTVLRLVRQYRDAWPSWVREQTHRILDG